MQNYSSLAAALLYAGCAFLPARRKVAVSGGTLTAWLLHGAALWAGLALDGTLRVGFAAMLSAALWVSVAAWWLENRNLALDGLRLMVLPCAAASALLPAVFPGGMVPLEGRSAWFGWHVVVALLAYGTLTIAAFHAVLMALQEARLHAARGGAKGGWLGAALDQLPALLKMESLLFRMITIGFTLLTLTVLSGVVFSEQLIGRAMKWDHKTVFTLLSWLLFGVLLAGRGWRGWRGKTALSLTLAGFVTLLLAYVGSRFVLEVIVQRGGA